MRDSRLIGSWGLLLTMLLHAAINNSKEIVPSGVLGGTDTIGFYASRISWISLALLCASAAYFLNDMRKQTLGCTSVQFKKTM
jgi:hypothetical protein